MIGKLTGIVDSVTERQVLLDVQGVGYLISCSAPTLARLPGAGQGARLLIETIVRDDGWFLFGFREEAERGWFRLLTSVQGVGPKVALAILSVLPPERLALALAAGDKAAIQQADGVGGKLAARLITELKDKTGDVLSPAIGATLTAVASGAEADALSALVNLGYKRMDAAQALAAVRAELKDADAPTLIRQSLKRLTAAA